PRLLGRSARSPTLHPGVGDRPTHCRRWTRESDVRGGQLGGRYPGEVRGVVPRPIRHDLEDFPLFLGRGRTPGRGLPTLGEADAPGRVSHVKRPAVIASVRGVAAGPGERGFTGVTNL